MKAGELQRTISLLCFSLSHVLMTVHTHKYKMASRVICSGSLVKICSLFGYFSVEISLWSQELQEKCLYKVMPGDKCAVLGCGSCRRTKGIGLWKLPSQKDEAHKKWRKEWLSEITKTREIDQDFKKRLEKDRVFTCEKHFKARHWNM